ncbi:MAG: hypothetical protein NT013_21170 [Planctomycetia bacterium]|nr:hypothetical protein [Planctomycetia bacterium]
MPILRAGTTLTEVLMSLLIMSIGVMQVATLFPIAALRTLEANKQTNTTVSRFTIESLIDVDPQLVHNPDGVFPFPGAAAGVTDSTPYNSAISIVPPGPPAQATFRGQTYLVDPIGWQGFNYDQANPAIPLPWYPVIPPFPLGSTPSPRDWFGNTVPASVNWDPPRRYTGASLFAIPYPTTASALIAAKIRAAQLMVQPDNWKLVTEGQYEVGGPTTSITSVTLDGDADLSLVTATGIATGSIYRVVIFDIDGTHSETRPLAAAPTGQSVSWASPLPTRFEVSPSTGATPNIGKVRIEVADQVYSSMLSVRKRAGGAASIDVVVFFKRNFDPNHERVFQGDFRMWDMGPNGVPGGAGDDNGINGANDPGELGYPGSDDVPNGIVTLKCPSSAADDERPNPRRGGYIYDTKNGLWYRVRAIQNKLFGVGAGSNEDWVDVVLDESIKANNTEDLNNNQTLDPFEDSNGDGVITRGGAILHSNVANVFPLEIKVP